MLLVPFKIDLKAVRKKSKGRFWFRQNFDQPKGPNRWTVGYGKATGWGESPESALADLLEYIDIAADEIGL